MRWSATRLAPCRRSSACPWASSAFASIKQMLLTMPPHCKANAVELPTNPPPPMMLTFMDGSFLFSGYVHCVQTGDLSKILHVPRPKRGVVREHNRGDL